MNKKVNKERERDYLRLRRLKAIEAYGGKCACPGCDVNWWEFLNIDHINGGGAKDRRETGLVCNKLYLWLIKHNFPKGKYQLLCWNCNMAKFQFGVCPHVQRASVPKPARLMKTFGRGEFECVICKKLFSRQLSRVNAEKPTCGRPCSLVLLNQRWTPERRAAQAELARQQMPGKKMWQGAVAWRKNNPEKTSAIAKKAGRKGLEAQWGDQAIAAQPS